jgi:sterol desaturase/sphingolipid hydroxylase (fatty acid hydroxylase superfamily)
MITLTALHLFGVVVRPITLALGFLTLLLVAEAVYVRARKGHGAYDVADAVANMGMYGGYLLILFVWSPFLFLIYDAVHEFAPFDLGRESRLPMWLVWTLLVVAEDLCFYVFHRASHRVRLLWASHENHHSSTSFNLSVALRQTWTPFIAFVFWLPLPLLGFDPFMILTVQMASLTFQAFLHTELVGALGPFGLVFNTPAHHRVHHGADPECLDKNFGGVLIIWDRLFASFHAGAPSSYGVPGTPRRLNPIAIGFGEWRAMILDLVRPSKRKVEPR